MRPVPGLPIEQQSGLIHLRMLVYGEARNQGAVGRIAVAAVVYNRCKKKSKTVSDIVLQHSGNIYQFTCMSPDDPNRAKLLDAWQKDPETWARCDEACELWESSLVPDPTKGATHYYNPKVASPKWGRGFSGWQETAVIREHVFGVTPW